ncbi:MAG: hypothetical protein PHP64_07705 [Actinomycetota bacterium]|nr:hypothetical protein [Actinomycetota bacterium]
MKKQISGIVQNLSTNPFKSSSQGSRDSALLSFDLNFDLIDEDGKVHHVWFFRSFKMPPPIEDGDHIEVLGEYGRLLGFIGKRNFYAERILDRQRNMEYTAWRDKGIEKLQQEEK